MRIPLVLLTTLLAGDAFAHTRTITRALLFEAWDDGRLHVACSVEVPEGDAKRAWLTLADENRDGNLDPTEQDNLRGLLVQRGLFGLILRVETATVSLEKPEAKLRADPKKGPIELMLLGTVSIGPRAVHVSVSTAATGDTLDLVVLPGARAISKTSRGKLGRGFKTKLGDSDVVRWSYGPLEGKG